MLDVLAYALFGFVVVAIAAILLYRSSNKDDE